MMVSKDGMYSMLIGQNELETDIQSADYKPNNKQDLPQFTVRDGPRVRPYKLATAGLGLLCTTLLIVIIALCIHFQNSYRLRGELDSIASNHSTVTKALEQLQGEYQEALDAKHRVEEQFGLQHSEQEQLQKKIESLLVEKKDLQSLVSMHENSCGKCLPGWRLFDSRCYYFSYHESKPKKSWSGGREDCITKGADLAVVDSEQKQLFLMRTITSMSLGRAYSWHLAGFWLGLRDVHVEGTWKWLNGTQLTVGYWMDGEPNDTYSEEDCAAIYPISDLLKSWNDAPCNYLLNWICESELTNP
ncbi:hepatic lectin-like [Brienomyrus brachyistius]|uniref:hepatic lectin-like n=1 Tax=Brienomyrus brachyistius TaxID=42636 RepID=UPI0020B3A324|nr:hepatic lectin-like [Brienomyrus brachyistius]